jgi:hypothetical protein
MRCSLYFPHCWLDFGYAHRVMIHTQMNHACTTLPVEPGLFPGRLGPVMSFISFRLLLPLLHTVPLCDRRRAGPALSPSHPDDCETFIIMCGIIAVFESQTTSSCKQDELSSQIQDSLGYIAHRGPDANAVWVNDDATCGR